jgi:hypothetical protein
MPCIYLQPPNRPNAYRVLLTTMLPRFSLEAIILLDPGILPPALPSSQALKSWNPFFVSLYKIRTPCKVLTVF